MTEDPIARMLPALSVGHVAGDMPQRPLGRRYAMTWRALFLDWGGNPAAPAVRLRGLFLPPAARAGPSRPLCGLAWRSGGFPRPSFASLRAGRV